MRYLAFGPDIPREALRYYYISKFNLDPNPKFENRGNKENHFTIISIQDQNNSERIVKNFISCSGFEVNGKRIIIMQMCFNMNQNQYIYNLMTSPNGILDTLFDSKFDGLLNISDFNNRFNTNLDLNERGVLDFILFLFALRSFNSSKEVRVIDFRHNGVRFLEAFAPSKKIFPSLETVYTEGNNFSEQYYLLEEIRLSGVVMQQSTCGSKKKPDFLLYKKPEPSIEYNPPMLATNKVEEPNIEINPSEFIANPFLISFLQQSFEDMGYIFNYYDISAIMSVTTETSSDLIPYQQFARSLMHGRDIYAQGPEQINELNIAIFGQSVMFNINKIQACEVVQCGYLMVLHGTFVDQREAKIGFDRSLLIGQNNNAFFITNDQIHFRSIMK